MSFVQQPGRPFTKQNVETLPPNQVGVYGIYNASQWIYIGQGNLRERLLAHLSGDNPCILRNSPTHWVAEATSDPAGREKVLLGEIATACNQRAG